MRRRNEARATRYMVAAVVALGLLANGGCPDDDKPEGRGPARERGPTAVEVAAVGRGAVGGSEKYVGELQAPEVVELACKLAGRLDAVKGQLGERVLAGATLARIDDAQLRAQLEEAESATAVARASVQRAEVEDRNAAQELERKEPLARQDLITRQELDNVRTRRDASAAQRLLAKAQAQQAQARVKLLKQQLADTRITAPFTGSVDRRYLDPGAVVNPGTPVLRLVKTDPILVRFKVPEREVGGLRRRMSKGNLQVEVELDAYPDESIHATVARIAPSIEASSRAAAVEAEIDNSDGRLMPGMYGRVTLELEPDRQRPLVPLRAIIDRAGSGPGKSVTGQATVFVVENNKAHARAVRLGREDSERGEVLDGLREGEQVVIAGQSALRDGAQVEVVQGAAAPSNSSKTEDGGPRP